MKLIYNLLSLINGYNYLTTKQQHMKLLFVCLILFYIIIGSIVVVSKDNSDDK